METKKVKAFMMFYPIDWQRHIFDYTEQRDMPAKVKELKAKYPNVADDITFVEWGETDASKYDDSLAWDEECLNNWDDDITKEERKENKAMIKGKKPRLTESFIMAHWCVAVREEVKAAILDELLF